MEHQPSDNTHGPDREPIAPREVNPTGSTELKDTRRDVIGDAITGDTAHGEGSDLNHERHGDQRGAPTTRDAPLPESAVEKVNLYLREAFSEADERGEEISREDARAIATLLAPIAGTDSAMRRFADTGEVDDEQLRLECQQLSARTWRTPEALEWLSRLGRHLDLPSGRAEEVLPRQAQRGLDEFGDAFAAYLRLPDVHADQDDLIDKFHEFHAASFSSMTTLIENLTEVLRWEHALDALADQWGIQGLVALDRGKVEAMARAHWDIVELNGRFHAFNR